MTNPALFKFASSLYGCTDFYQGVIVPRIAEDSVGIRRGKIAVPTPLPSMNLLRLEALLCSL